MRILLANHHLDERAGSELYIYELAHRLRLCGHEVAVFTFFEGLISQKLAGEGFAVLGPNTQSALIAFAPEVIHTHHLPCFYYLAGQPLNAPILHSVLGVAHPFEAPPTVTTALAFSLVLSAEAQQALSNTPFLRDCPHEIFPNWFDDQLVSHVEITAPKACNKVLVISNHLDAGLRDGLKNIASRRPEFSWEHVGYPNNSQEIDEKLLRDADVIVTIGRTVLLAAGMGKVCLVYDFHGSDGLLTIDSFESIAKTNFSGRHLRARPTVEQLEDLLCVQSLQVDVRALANKVWPSYKLADRISRLETIYQGMIANFKKHSARIRKHYQGWGDVYGLSSIVASRDKRKLKELQAEKKVADERIAQMERSLRDVSHALATLRFSRGQQFIQRLKNMPVVYPAYMKIFRNEHNEGAAKKD